MRQNQKKKKKKLRSFGSLDGEEFACNAGDLDLGSMCLEDPLEKQMAIHFNILA